MVTLQNDNILILGGNGFLGRFLVKELCKTHAHIIVASRHAMDAYQFQTMGSVGQIALKTLNLLDSKALEQLISQSTIVINLVGILYETKKQKFNTLHYEVPQKIAKLCVKHKIKRLIHISASGVDHDVLSNYARSKFAGENVVLETFSNSTIIRPNVMFGEGDNFLNKFKFLSSFSPIVPLVNARTKFQPVYVGDVARLVVKILTRPEPSVIGEVLEVAGPKVLTLEAIVRLVLTTLKRRRLTLNMPLWLAKLQATVLEKLPQPLLTRDQITLLQRDHICPPHKINALALFGLEMTPIQSKISNILD